MNRDIFSALADPTRRAIVTLLAAGAMTPGDLAHHFHTSRQAVSKHLHLLTECALLQSQAQGRETYYTLEVQKMQELDHWLKPFRKLWEDRMQALDAVLKNMP